MAGLGGGREAVSMQRSKQPVAAAIAGEHAARSIGAMRSRGEPDHDEASVRVAEPRYGPPPVLLIAVRRTFLGGNVLTPFDEAGTLPAIDDGRFQEREAGATHRFTREVGASQH